MTNRQLRTQILQRLTLALEQLPEDLPDQQLEHLHNAVHDIETIVAVTTAKGPQVSYVHFLERQS